MQLSLSHLGYLPDSLKTLTLTAPDAEGLPDTGLFGYFLEADATDAFRSIAFTADPVFALLRFWELRDAFGDPDIVEMARLALFEYIEKYLLADCNSNPFSLTPYGVFHQPQQRDRQLFRDAGEGRGVRTFMHPFNNQGIVHGTNSVLMSHAHLLAKAAALFERPDWRAAAERLLHWCLGHNTLNCSLFTGIGYRQPVGYSYRIPQLPEAMVNGFIGRPDDTPYLEESTAIEWNKLFAFRNSRSISDESALAIPQPAFTENAVLCLR